MKQDFFDLIGGMTGDKKYDKETYHCIKLDCDAELERIVVQTTMKEPRKLFFCPNYKCVRYGLYTTVASRRKK